MANPQQTASRIVDEIIADVMDRRGLQYEWDAIDDDVKAEIRQTLIDITATILTEDSSGS